MNTSTTDGSIETSNIDSFGENSNNSDITSSFSSSQITKKIMNDNLLNPETQAEIKTLVSKFKSRSWLKTVRPVTIFLQPSLFSAPRNSHEAATRLELNLSYFLTNYAIVCVIVSFYSILVRPFLIIIAALNILLWNYALRFHELQIGTITLKGNSKYLFLGSVSFLCVFFFAGSTIFMIIGICSTLILLHALFHREVSESDLNADVELNSVDSII